MKKPKKRLTKQKQLLTQKNKIKEKGTNVKNLVPFHNSMGGFLANLSIAK